MTFRINFTSPDRRAPDFAAVWTGYATYQDALAALRDADAIIPIHWDHDIVEDAPAPQEAIA